VIDLKWKLGMSVGKLYERAAQMGMGGVIAILCDMMA